MLTLHFMEMQECFVEHRGGETSVCTGIVDRKCDPVAICQKAVDNVKGLRCDDDLGEYGEVDFIVEDYPCTVSQGKIEFSFLPRYLLLLTEELLKNSAYATLLNRADDPRGLNHFPVTITVGSNNQQVVIKICDRGGGISEGSAEKLWSYSWSRHLGGFVKPMNQLASFDDPLEGLKQQRLGMGLPLCRLYTKYLGGSLQLMSVPGAGVDTYLVLSRIDPESITPTCESLDAVMCPVDRIQQYFGSEVALYFAWLNHFTLWLLAPAVVGLLCYLRMRCFGFTVDDDPYLPFYSLFVVFWGISFLRSWDRHSAEQAWRWNVHGVDTQPEEHRAEFIGELRTSRVTGQPERYYPESKRFCAYILSVVVTSFMLSISFFVMICSLNLQGYMEESVTSFEQAFYIAPLARLADHGAIFDPNQTEYFGLIAFGPVALHVFAIMNLNKLYRSVAEWLTEKENHERLDHHRSSLMAKRFMFEAFDCYISLFYVGFVQQDIRKLRQELMCLYGVDSLRRVFLESILPLVLEQISKQRLSRKVVELKRLEGWGRILVGFRFGGYGSFILTCPEITKVYKVENLLCLKIGHGYGVYI
eukprot:symbB.v1.2.021492.t1/scaffold1806.1/size131321/7